MLLAGSTPPMSVLSPTLFSQQQQQQLASSGSLSRGSSDGSAGGALSNAQQQGQVVRSGCMGGAQPLLEPLSRVVRDQNLELVGGWPLC
jgi:hypothetical protein